MNRVCRHDLAVLCIEVYVLSARGLGLGMVIGKEAYVLLVAYNVHTINITFQAQYFMVHCVSFVTAMFFSKIFLGKQPCSHLSLSSGCFLH